MKKIFKRLTLFSILIMMAFMVSGCSKKAITAETFEIKMESKGYDVEDVTSQYSSQIDIKKGYVAIDEDGEYQIEFYELGDNDTAISMYDNNKSVFESSKGSVSSEASVSGSNFSKYSLSTGGKYKVICRVDNTLIYLNVPSSKKDEVKKVLDSLGY